MEAPLYALIIAGGVGARFWPRSRKAQPKQCMSLDGGPTLIQRTLSRLEPLIPAERVFVVTAQDMAPLIREQLPQLPADQVLVEPMGRNTAAAVGWGTLEIARRAKGQDPIIAVLPADHLIQDTAELRSLLADCAQAAEQTHSLITLGIQPTRPETGFGYLELGPLVGDFGEHRFHVVERFVEKPKLNRAQQYLAGGRHLWNAGMFVFTAEVCRDAFRTHLPSTWGWMETLRHSPERLEEIYPQLEKVSFDVGIMERAANVLTVPASMGWSDLGSWEAVAEHLPEQPGGVGVGDIVAVDAQDNVVHAPGKTVALLGVSGLVVVDTGDALLVCPKDQAQRVRELHAALLEQGKEGLL